jgi:hypothetical protein
MITIVQVIVIVALEWGLQSWIWLALVPLAFGLAAHASPGRAAGRGAAAGFLSWFGVSLYLYLTSGRIIAGRIAALFGLGQNSGWLMVLASGLLGALVAALAALAGASVRAAIKKTGDADQNASV